MLLLRSFACVCCWLLERVVSTLSFIWLLVEFFLNLEVPSQGLYVARYIISSTLRVGFLASFSSVSKYLTDWDIFNVA